MGFYPIHLGSIPSTPTKLCNDNVTINLTILSHSYAEYDVKVDDTIDDIVTINGSGV